MFDDILQRKKLFLGNKNINFQRLKKGFFLENFHLFILHKISKENVFENILNRIKDLFDTKNIVFKRQTIIAFVQRG